MKVIKLMTDYGCYPLWHVGPDEFGDMSPNDLPISESLQKSLLAWAEEFESILNMNDPASSKFQTKEDEEKFIQKGYILAQRLRDELGSNYEIIYEP